tara:strand:+ start:3632 stop:4405 length:774 start_codon:yes stop_codon:yes gene_type:complete
MSEKKNQLHQLLAVESDVRAKAQKILQEAKNTFLKKADHFDGLIKTYEPFEVSDADGVSSTKIAEEAKNMVTTVADKINYVKKSVISALDAHVSKEETNSSGTVEAELTVDGKSLGNWSAQSLLAIESNLVKIRDVFNSIPTLDPVKQWDQDPSKNSVYRTPEQETYRTEKKHKVIVKFPSTKEHPAQTELLNIDQQVGVIKTVYSSGRITPKQKSDYLGRIDALIVAVKKARSRANQAEVKNSKIGKLIFDYILTS